VTNGDPMDSNPVAEDLLGRDLERIISRIDGPKSNQDAGSSQKEAKTDEKTDKNPKDDKDDNDDSDGDNDNEGGIMIPIREF
jgi:ribosomal protein L12E/L44/L45/RPP1/RPP2